jgi:hypothetical protein
MYVNYDLSTDAAYSKSAVKVRAQIEDQIEARSGAFKMEFKRWVEVGPGFII